MAEHDYMTNEKAEKHVESPMSELLRNSQATLAIAEQLEVHQQAPSKHGASLDAKFTDVQDQLAEVEDVLADGASKAAPDEDENEGTTSGPSRRFR